MLAAGMLAWIARYIAIQFGAGVRAAYMTAEVCTVGSAASSGSFEARKRTDPSALIHSLSTWLAYGLHKALYILDRNLTGVC